MEDGFEREENRVPNNDACESQYGSEEPGLGRWREAVLTRVSNFCVKVRESMSKEEQDCLYEEYREYIRPQTELVKVLLPSPVKNVLVKLVSEVMCPGQNDAPQGWAVRRLIQDYPKLLEEVIEGQNSLFRAIEKKVLWFIQIVIESNLPEVMLHRILGPWTKQQEESQYSKDDLNCISKAIEIGIEPSLIIKLINMASNHTLVAQDANGLTPLHHAVKSTRCDSGVIHALLERGESALDKVTIMPYGLSVLEYHVATWQNSNTGSEGGIAKTSNIDKKPPTKDVGASSQGKDMVSALPENDHGIFTSSAGGVEHVVSGTRRQSTSRATPMEDDQNPTSNQGPPPSTTQPRSQKQASGQGSALRTMNWQQNANNTSRKPTNSHSSPSTTRTRSQKQPTNQRSAQGTINGQRPATQASRIPTNNQRSPSITQSRNQKQASGQGSALRTMNGQQNATQASQKPTNNHSSPSTTRPQSQTHPESQGTRIEIMNGQEYASQVSKSRSDEVVKLLKLHYFRTTFPSMDGTTRRDHSGAERFVYGKRAGRTCLSFIFPPPFSLPQKDLRFSEFEAGYQSLAFDPILIHLRFGSFTLRSDPKQSDDPEDIPVGRRDLGKFFHWLYKTKGVKHIIMLEVDDKAARSHCDQAIVEVLERFDVEILNWQKVDLCPLVIQQASQRWSRFHELHLWWSGNNGILRGWSDSEGLAIIASLKTVHLYEEYKPLDSRAYTDKRVQEFIERLNSNRENHNLGSVNVKHHRFEHVERTQISRNSYTNGSTQDTPGKKIDEHQWLKAMDNFSRRIKRLALPDFRGHPDDYESLRKDVTIALIDDGVDFMNQVIASKLDSGKYFPSGYLPENLRDQPAFHDSATQHGTNMAYQIQRICPFVKIFVCRIDTLQRPGEKPKIVAKSAVDALEWAVEQGFDIISMSWTIKKNDSDNSEKGMERLKNVLSTCEAKGKSLLFCSAPDIGQPSAADDYYPFGCTEVVKKFKIGAATADGSVYPWAGKEIDYILPGENVVLRQEDQKYHQSVQNCPKTGSSVATALAAGLAALIIHCVKLGAIYNASKEINKDINKGVTEKVNKGNNKDISKIIKGRVSTQTLRVVKTFDVMKSAFDLIKSSGTSDDTEKRLGVEAFFARHGNLLKKMETGHESEDEKWDIIEELARNLVPLKMEEAAVEAAAKAEGR